MWTPAWHGKAPPAQLSAQQTYDVALASTRPGGDLTTVDPVERLSPVPSANQPRLVELGVLRGGQSVLFAVLPGTTLSGPGICIPGTIDCEVLALDVNQVETVSGQGGPAVDIGVTAITVRDHGTAAAAQHDRTSTSSEGQTLLASAALTAPSLFPYDPRLGVLVDLRNLSAGGS